MENINYQTIGKDFIFHDDLKQMHRLQRVSAQKDIGVKLKLFEKLTLSVYCCFDGVPWP